LRIIKPPQGSESCYQLAAANDVIRQFRYYLVDRDLPGVAVRFRSAVRISVDLLRQRPNAGARYRLGPSQLRVLRSLPVTGFEAVRIFYVVEEESLRIIRILDGKRDLKRILRNEGNS
jgi:plasmid stabilization system protein ParE